MKKCLTLCLVLLTAAALTAPAYADVIVSTPAEDAAQLVGILLVGLVVAVTAWLLLGFRKK